MAERQTNESFLSTVVIVYNLAIANIIMQQFLSFSAHLSERMCDIFVYILCICSYVHPYWMCAYLYSAICAIVRCIIMSIMIFTAELP